MFDLPKVTLARRFIATVLVAVVAIWTVITLIYYQSNATNPEDRLPQPARIAAIAEMLEEESGEGRDRLVSVLTTPDFLVKVVPQGSSGAPEGIDWQPVEAKALAHYAGALDGRSLSLLWEPVTTIGASPLFERTLARGHLFFRIGLSSGDTLSIETREPILVNRYGVPTGLAAGTFGSLIALLALIVMYRQTRPLRRLAAAVDSVDFGGEPVALPDARRSAPEIRAVILAFDRLQSRLSAMLTARLALIGGISHDVRTFATRLRLRVDAIPSEAERERAIADISDMIRLLDDALVASRAGAGVLGQEMVEFAEIVEKEVEARRIEGGRADLRVGASARDALVLGDRLALRRVVANLIDNALKYGHAAHAAVAIDDEWLALSVADEGTGIPPEQRALMLEPFARLETSRNRRTGGAGLGLAIARSLAEAHGGRIEIGTAPKGGALLTLWLPLFRPE